MFLDTFRTSLLITTIFFLKMYSSNMASPIITMRIIILLLMTPNILSYSSVTIQIYIYYFDLQPYAEIVVIRIYVMAFLTIFRDLTCRLWELDIKQKKKK